MQVMRESRLLKNTRKIGGKKTPRKPRKHIKVTSAINMYEQQITFTSFIYLSVKWPEDVNTMWSCLQDFSDAIAEASCDTLHMYVPDRRSLIICLSCPAATERYTTSLGL